MRIISQDGKVDVIYEENGLKIEASRIYCITHSEKLYLGMYPNGNADKAMKVMEMIRHAAIDGQAIFQMPKTSEVQ